jgi:subtilisin family serine protease
MTGFCRWALLLALALPGPGGNAAAQQLTPQETQAQPRQILVMLHLPPPRYQPGSSYRAYGDDNGRGARQAIAQDLARNYKLKLQDRWPMPALDIDCFVMELAAGDAAEPLLERLAQDPRVKWAQAMAVFTGMAQGDPLAAIQPGAGKGQIEQIHKTSTGRAMRVAVIDSGVDDSHPDLLGQVAIRQNFIDGKPYLPEAHGTGVAGIIVARADNGIGIAGMAPGARLMALRACWEEPSRVTLCNSFTLGKALNFAISNDAHIINLSLSGPTDRLLQRLLEIALARGIKVVGAVDPRQADGGFPASHPGVLAVADGARQRFTGRFVVAPGRDIPTTSVGARWRLASGSSYSTAYVSGLLALIGELRPLSTLEPGQAFIIADTTLTDPHATASVDLCATLGKAAGKCVCPCPAQHAQKVPLYP